MYVQHIRIFQQSDVLIKPEKLNIYHIDVRAPCILYV
jgi:hypothetical protein